MSTSQHKTYSEWNLRLILEVKEEVLARNGKFLFKTRTNSISSMQNSSNKIRTFYRAWLSGRILSPNWHSPLTKMHFEYPSEEMDDQLLLDTSCICTVVKKSNIIKILECKTSNGLDPPPKCRTLNNIQNSN